MTETRAVRRTTGDDRVLAGVAGGIGRALGVDPVLVRVLFVALSLANGIGVVAYVLCAIFLPSAPDDDVDRLDPVGVPRRVEQGIGVAMIAIGVLLLVRRTGLFLPEAFVLPSIVVAAAAAVGWVQIDGRATASEGRSAIIRIGIGALLLAFGIGLFVALNQRLVVASQVVLAVLVATGGILVLAGPWILRLGRLVSVERAERIRADERAEVAAHLHDSVLQTLALIQRRADSPAETVALARRQERELRAWLYETDQGRRPAAEDDAGGGSVADALRALADEVEADHAIVVEVVVVGDAALDEAGAALVGAAREAVVNAAKHSGAPTVSVYGEVSDGEIVAYVRDRGVGFDPDRVSADRRGLADSVRGRIARHGGTVEIGSAPQQGTEVSLAVPTTAVVT